MMKNERIDYSRFSDDARRIVESASDSGCRETISMRAIAKALFEDRSNSALAFLKLSSHLLSIESLATLLDDTLCNEIALGADVLSKIRAEAFEAGSSVVFSEHLLMAAIKEAIELSTDGSEEPLVAFYNAFRESVISTTGARPKD